MVLSAHRRFWMRFLCVAVACIGLTVVLRHLNFHELVTALARANYMWYFASALAYGFVFLPAAWRWHLALRAAGCEISWATSLTFTFSRNTSAKFPRRLFPSWKEIVAFARSRHLGHRLRFSCATGAERRLRPESPRHREGTASVGFPRLDLSAHRNRRGYPGYGC